MIWTNANCLYGVLLISSAFTACAMYAYYKNTKRLANDPKKREFHRAAIFLVPFTWPLFLVAFLLLLVLRVTLFVLKAVAFGIFLVLFPFVLFGLRVLVILTWVDKILTSIGNQLMEANTFLIRLFLRPWADSSGSA